jgi:hypothetical protein
MCKLKSELNFEFGLDSKAHTVRLHASWNERGEEGPVPRSTGRLIKGLGSDLEDLECSSLLACGKQPPPPNSIWH